MKILAIDTATRACSVAVTHDSTLVTEINLVSKTTHSRHLMELIDRSLKIGGYSLSEMEGYAVTVGPGSFTGLRIGLSVIKGLCSVTKRPVAGVSTLDALAYDIPYPAFNIIAMVDARKGEVYTASYRSEEGGVHKTSGEEVLRPEEVLDGIDEKTIFIGSGSTTYRELIMERAGGKALFLHPSRNEIRASTVARLALERFEAGDTDDLSTLVPFYIRRSDAEINLDRKQQAAGL